MIEGYRRTASGLGIEIFEQNKQYFYSYNDENFPEESVYEVSDKELEPSDPDESFEDLKETLKNTLVKYFYSKQ